MITEWTLPTIFSQYSEEGAETAHIAWDGNFDALRNLDGRSMQSEGTLIHTARSPKLDIRNKTYYFRATGFNFKNLPDTLSGIEVRLSARRYGRATDDVIQLCLNGEFIGENQATEAIAPQKIYGSNMSLWSTKNLSLSDIKNETFGIVIRFQAHPHWPHKDPVLVDAVEIRIH